jgi:transglutaminase-like putative cysteine protease
MKEKKSSVLPQRWWDLPAIFILFIILTTAFTRLVATDWTPGLIVTRYITYLGIIAGLALGQSRFSPRLAFFIAFIYGLFVVPWRLGMLMGEGILWQERLTSMGGRLQTIVTQLSKQQAVTDSFLFLVLMGLLFWTLSVYTAYSLTRYAHPWRVILPTGIALVLIHSYDTYLTSRAWYLVIYLFFALILVARLVYLHNRNRWKQSNTYMPPYLGVDFVRIALVATTALLLLTWTTPAIADTLPQAEDVWQRIKQPWNELRNTLDNAFASLRSTIGIVSDYYGPNLSLGRGNRLTDTLIFTVQVPENPPEGVRFYWRSRAYDYYDNGWKSTLLTTEMIDPNETGLKFPDSEDNAPGLFPFAFSIGSPLSTLPTPHQVIWVSRPVKLELEYNENGEADLATVRATPPLRAGETYNVRSSLNKPTVVSMRNAGTDYPEWVTDRYLQLPQSITPRTRQLAAQIAEGKENPYDIAVAVTDYLRNNIEYTETVPPLPNDQELIDWFLFDLKQGFCNYYATAEIVLLRSLGIPARLGVGYAQGEPVEGANAYTVLQRDSHAWPEVYFPGIGWVEFEPTVSQPEIIRPTGERDNSNASQASSPGSEIEPPTDEELDRLRNLEDAGALGDPTDIATKIIGIGAILIGLLLALVLLLIPLARRKRLHERIQTFPILLEMSLKRIGIHPPNYIRSWANRARLSPLARSYHEINAALSRLSQPPSPTDTPAERVASLENTLPPASQPAHRLLAEYQTATYSRDYTADLAVAQKAGGDIRNLSYRAWVQRLINKGSKA